MNPKRRCVEKEVLVENHKAPVENAGYATQYPKGDGSWQTLTPYRRGLLPNQNLKRKADAGKQMVLAKT